MPQYPGQPSAEAYPSSEMMKSTMRLDIVLPSFLAAVSPFVLFGRTLARVQSGRIRGSSKCRSTLGSKRVSAVIRDPASVTTIRLVARNTSPVGSRE